MSINMNPPKILSRLVELDIRLWMEEDRLRYSAPKGAMSPELQEELVKHKAEIIAYLRDAAGSRLTLFPRPEAIPLSFTQQRLWFLDRLAPGSAAYNMFSAVRLHGQLDVAALEQGFSQLVQRHESLRTNFVAPDGEPRQVIAQDMEVKLPVIDLSAQAEQESEILRLAREEAGKPFDLS